MSSTPIAPAQTLGVGSTLPALQNDTKTVRGTKTVVAATRQNGVLGNDSDPDGDTLTVTAVSAAVAGNVGTPLVGQYGSLTLGADGTYSYTADHAAALAEGLSAHDLFTYTAADQDGNASSATLDVAVVGHAGGVMDVDTFTAVESTTGDTISGILYDNTGRYTVGSSVNTGRDQLGGSWTYTVTGVARADNVHQDVAYSGHVYDFDYFDADTGQTFNTVYGYAGAKGGISDKANFSGNNYLGSDGDLVSINGAQTAIASGRYVVPEGLTVESAMRAVTFEAKESVTGDVITGVLYDDRNQYTVGSTVTTGTDQAGGQWTYTVTSIADADAKHQDASYAGYVYDLTYTEATLNITTSTVFGAKGFNTGTDDRTKNYSGKDYLGSDGDVILFAGQDLAVASGKYVVQGIAVAGTFMLEDHFTAIESKTGDTISGVLFDDLGLYSVGSTVTKGLDTLGGTWTYTIDSIDVADTAHQSASYNGYVYDLTYYDADVGKTYNTVYGTTGLDSGVADRTRNYSGKQGLGSDGDLVVVDGADTAIASGKYVVPEHATTTAAMQADGFRAVESATGDVILGVVYDNTGHYSVGSTVTSGTDLAGGNWTYTITSVGTADAAHQDASYAGYQYDYIYSDHDLDLSVKTTFGASGIDTGRADRSSNYSGSNGLGSDGDVVSIGGQQHAVASGLYTLPEGLGARLAIARIGDIPVNGAATVDLDGKTDFAGTVTFNTASGMLQIEQASMFDGVISQFDAHDRIDLADISFNPSTSLAYADNADHSGGTLTVDDGFHSANLALLGNYTAASFALLSDGHGGTLVTDPFSASQQAQLAPPSA